MILFCSYRLIGICHFPVITLCEHKTPIPEKEKAKVGFGERMYLIRFASISSNTREKMNGG
jgi:hypothetical protein